jgi:hypothetical protein
MRNTPSCIELLLLTTSLAAVALIMLIALLGV